MHAGEDDGALDGRALHAVPGQRVGVLDVLGHILGGQLADEVGVGLDRDAIGVHVAHGAAHAVVDVDAALVAPQDHPITDRDAHRTVIALLA